MRARTHRVVRNPAPQKQPGRDSSPPKATNRQPSKSFWLGNGCAGACGRAPPRATKSTARGSRPRPPATPLPAHQRSVPPSPAVQSPAFGSFALRRRDRLGFSVSSSTSRRRSVSDSQPRIAVASCIKQRSQGQPLGQRIAESPLSTAFSGVAAFVRDVEVAGSNPVAPIRRKT